MTDVKPMEWWVSGRIYNEDIARLRAELVEARAEIERLTDNKWSKIELALAEYDAKRIHDQLFKEHHGGREEK